MRMWLFSNWLFSLTKLDGWFVWTICPALLRPVLLWPFFAIALVSFVQPALASNDDGGRGDISYSHISIFGHVGEGVFDADFKGGIVRGSYGFGDHFFVLGDYAAQRTDDAIVLGPLSDKVTTEQGHLGVGFHTPIAAKTD